ncbi:MAG: helix-turn-helix domain-containing protein [Acidimicrobiia bacterium]
MTIRQDQMQRATARRIAEAATALFLQRGYRATTIADLAAEAGVAIQTIYNVVGSKAAVLNLVLDETVSGSEAPRPVPEFMSRRTEQLADATDIIDVLADWFVEVHARSGPVFRMIREAAAVDSEVAAFEREREDRRMANYRMPARLMVEKSPRRCRLGEEEAAAAIWSLAHPRVYQKLVSEGVWSPERYRQWLVVALTGALLEPE